MELNTKSEEKLRAFLIKHLNEKRLNLKNFQRINKGWETDLYQFTLNYHENSKEKTISLILRIYSGVSSKEKAEWEFFVLERLYEKQYPVPKPYFQESTGSILGRPFIIMEQIMGEDQGEIFLKELKKNSTQEIYSGLIFTLCQLLFRLHTLDWRILSRKAEKTTFQNEVDFLDARLKYFENRIVQYKLSLLIPILNWLKNQKSQVSSTKTSIVHRDFHPHNIIINNRGEPFVIDWSSCGLGDFREDLGWTLFLISVYTSEKIHDQALTQYEALLGNKVEHIDYFEVLGMLRRLSDIMILFQESADSAGFRKEAKKIVKQTSFHLEKLVFRLKNITKLNVTDLNAWINRIVEM